MKSLRRALLGTSFGILVALAPAHLIAEGPQTAPAPPAAVRAPAAPQPVEPAEVLTPREQEDAELDRQRDELLDDTRDVVRIGQNVVVAEGMAVTDLVVIGGSATIHGRVLGDAVVILGTMTVGPTAVVDGDVVTIGGVATVSSGARLRRDLVVVGGGLDAPGDFAPGGEQVVIGTSGLGNSLNAVVPWVTGGLFLGRPLVPSLPWTWGFLAVVFFVYALLGVFFSKAVWSCAEVVTAKPMSTFMAGLLVLLLVGPVLFILTVSVVGIIVVPFAVAALAVGWLVGKVGVLRAVGHVVLPEPENVSKLGGIRSLAIGFAIVTVAYMIPVIGMLAFVLVAVFGLGSAWVAMLAAWRRENPAKPKPPKPVEPPTPPAPTTPAPYDGAVGEAGQSPPVAAFSELAPTAEAGAYAAAAASGATLSAAASDPAALLSMPKASLGQRAAAFGIDVVLVLISYNVLASDVFRSGPNGFFFLLLAYHVIFWAMKATTVGGIVCSLRVVRVDGTPLRFADALIRGFSSILSLVALGIGCLWIAYDADRQSWHDRIAGTYVVRVPKGWAL